MNNKKTVTTYIIYKDYTKDDLNYLHFTVYIDKKRMLSKKECIKTLEKLGLGEYVKHYVYRGR